jgi:hypothetical protein
VLALYRLLDEAQFHVEAQSELEGWRSWAVRRIYIHDEGIIEEIPQAGKEGNKTNDIRELSMNQESRHPCLRTRQHRDHRLSH